MRRKGPPVPSGVVSDVYRRRRTLVGLGLVSIIALVVSLVIDRTSGDEPERGDDDEVATAASEPEPTEDEEPEEPEEPEGHLFETDYEGLADPAGFLKPYPNATVEGLLTFRGNPSRSYYGAGPVPRTAPTILHQFPEEPMCRESVNLGETKTWCGMGWTGQPTIAVREDRTWAIFGGYDGNIHFMDADTGERILPDVETGDIIKGTPTIDPDGFPLTYSGSRDNQMRVIAFDRPGQAEVLWSLDAESVQPNLWNDDWDSSPIILDDYMLVGSESSRFWVIKLNRSYDAAGLVQVAPEVVFTDIVWDDEVLAANGDDHASVESSVAVFENTAYFGTSAGLIWGYDVSDLDGGRTPTRSFRFYTAGDNDATPIVDDEGMLYVAGQNDRPGPRATEVGQLTKLDPTNEANPIVWKYNETDAAEQGIYGTPGIVGDTIVATSDGGRLVALDRATGKVKWERQLPGPAWASPVIVDDVLLVGDCLEGNFHAFDMSDPDVVPPELWSVHLGGCIEATPAVWNGKIYIGSRAGHLYVLG